MSDFLGDRVPVERMCSLGCGTGTLERHLALLNAFRFCDAYDIAPGALDIARRDAEAAGLKGVSYQLADINTLPLAERAYDAIWFNSSLHHVRELEAACDRAASALKTGRLRLHQRIRVGADRFDFPMPVHGHLYSVRDGFSPR